MAERNEKRRPGGKRVTLSGDKNYDTTNPVEAAVNEDASAIKDPSKGAFESVFMPVPE